MKRLKIPVSEISYSDSWYATQVRCATPVLMPLQFVGKRSGRSSITLGTGRHQWPDAMGACAATLGRDAEREGNLAFATVLCSAISSC